jgi:cytochrome c2
LSIAGKDVDIETTMMVARLTDGRAMVTTDEMIMLSMADLGFTGAIEKLMEIAKLPGITQVSPVTMRLVFDKGAASGGAEKVAAATPAPKKDEAQMASAGDVTKGKKVFKKCKACHVVNKEKNRVGPHLVNIVGRPSGSVEGFKYSKAMKDVGIDWTAENLAKYLAKPKEFIPGNKMAFAGLRKESQIVDVIAYMESEAK